MTKTKAVAAVAVAAGREWRRGQHGELRSIETALAVVAVAAL